MFDPISRPHLSVIVAQASNRAIGKDNALLWHLSDDLRRFKALTTGHAIVMGRKTYESLPKRPLPRRRNLVISHDTAFRPEGAEVVHSVAELLHSVADEEETFVIGGAQVYSLLLPYADRIYLTQVYADFDADVFFPVVDLSLFALESQTEVMQDERSGLRYNYLNYVRRPSPSRGGFVG